MAAPDKPKSAAPFEWLAGGLFFGNKKDSTDDNIESCRDVKVLVTGLKHNMNVILEQSKQQEASLIPPPAIAPVGGESIDKDSPPGRITAQLSRLRCLLYDERSSTAQHDNGATASLRRGKIPTIAANLADALQKEGQLLLLLLQNLTLLPFESRKHVAAIFNYLLVCGLDGTDAFMYDAVMERFRNFLLADFERYMSTLVQGHDITATAAAGQGNSSDVALHCGAMFRSCLAHVKLYQRLVGTSEAVTRFVLPFMDAFCHVPNFDVASDAMESLRLIFCPANQHAEIPSPDAPIFATAAAEFMTRDYATIWDERFNVKLLSESANYMTRRVALQILSNVLLTRSNYAVMMQYVASPANLKLVMTLLRDRSTHITLDAFHVFKVFAANPNKPPGVEKILKDNQVKLVKYLKTLHADKEDSDEQFRDEKALIIQTIEAL